MLRVVTFVEKTSAALVRAAAPKATRYGLLCGVLSAALVLPLFSGSAAAVVSGPLQGQADQLTSQIVASGQRIRQLTLQFDRASDASASSKAELVTAQAGLQRVESEIAADRAVLQRQAVVAYVHGGSSGTDTSGSGQAAVDVSLRREYMSVAEGNLGDTLDEYRLEQRQLSAREAEVRQAQQAASGALAAVGAARQAALSQAAQEQATLDQINARLVQLAQQQALAASQARIEALAVAAPQAASRQGLPVNGGIVSAVVTAVSPPPPATGGGGAGGPWAALRQCESGGNYAENTANGYFGAYQFSQATWSGLGYPGRPDLEPPAMQDAAAQRLQAQGGWGEWPACSAALGL